MIVLNTRYASAERRHPPVAVAKSPIVTPISSPPGFARIRSTIAAESVDPMHPYPLTGVSAIAMAVRSHSSTPHPPGEPD